MFDISWQELFVIAVLTVVLVGPKELPRVLKTLTSWGRKARMLTRELQKHVDDIVREVEIEDLKREIQDSGRWEIGPEIKEALTVENEVAKALDVSEPRPSPAPPSIPLPDSRNG